ncbi:MAG: hypothetical protein Q7S57_06005 [bacterium]|nr:hypothetical protein [bacterium]
MLEIEDEQEEVNSSKVGENLLKGSVNKQTMPNKWFIGGVVVVFVLALGLIVQSYSSLTKTTVIQPSPSASVKPSSSPSASPSAGSAPDISVAFQNTQCTSVCPSPSVSPTPTPYGSSPSPFYPFTTTPTPAGSTRTPYAPLSQLLPINKISLPNLFGDSAEAASTATCSSVSGSPYLPKGTFKFATSILQDRNLEILEIDGYENGNNILWDFCKETFSAGNNIVVYPNPSSPDYVVNTKTEYNCNTKEYTCGIDPNGKARLCGSTNTTSASVYFTAPDSVGCIKKGTYLASITNPSLTVDQINKIKNEFGVSISGIISGLINDRHYALVDAVNIAVSVMQNKITSCYANPAVPGPMPGPITSTENCTSYFQSNMESELGEGFKQCYTNASTDISDAKAASLNTFMSTTTYKTKVCKVCGIWGLPTKACPNPPPIASPHPLPITGLSFSPPPAGVLPACPAAITAAITAKNTAQTMYDASKTVFDNNNAVLTTQIYAQVNKINVANNNLALAKTELDSAAKAKNTASRDLHLARRNKVSRGIIIAYDKKLTEASTRYNTANTAYLAAKKIADNESTNMYKSAEANAYIQASANLTTATNNLTAATSNLTNLKNSLKASAGTPLPACFTTS